MITVKAIGDYRAKWGEGPIWWNDALYHVDIEGYSVIRYEPKSQTETCWAVGERVGTVVPRASGELIIAGDSGFHILNTDDGKLTHIGDPEPDKTNNRFNDGKCSPDGRFFAGTISLVKETGDASLYRLDPDHTIHEVYAGVTNSNGIAWNAEGSLCYYIDTPTQSVTAFDYDKNSGVLANPHTVVKTDHVGSSPDGMTIDAEGKLWIAFCHGACVRRFCPHSGEELQVIDIPALETTAVAFGGDDLSDLYVTTGIHKTEVEEHAGRIFVISGLDVKGVPAFAFAG